MRRLSEKLAVLQSRLMTDDNHPVDSITSRRRQRAFTAPVKETGGDLKAKRLPLQLPPSQLPPSQLPPSQLPPSQLRPSQLPHCQRDKEKSSKNLMSDVNESQEASFPQELNQASSSTSSLSSVSVHSREVSQKNASDSQLALCIKTCRSASQNQQFELY